MNKESKSIFASKTFWGSVLAVAPQFLPALGVSEPTMQSILTVGGAALAVYGRLDAKAPVHVRKPKTLAQPVANPGQPDFR